MITAVPGIVAAVLAVSLLIVLHEAGHYLAARAFGMRVPRFSVGFGKVLLSFRRAGTEWAVSALPLGGYVRIEGMAPGEDVCPTDPAIYSNQAAWRRFLTILAGPAANYLVAALLAAALLATTGLREVAPGALVGKPTPGMPAAQVGLQDGDRIVVVAGVPVATWGEMVAQLQRHPGETIALELERGGARRAVQITPVDQGGRGVVGFGPHYQLVHADGQSLSEGFRRTTTAVWQQVSAFGAVFARRHGGGSLSGPVGIVQQLLAAIREGPAAFWSFIWTLSVALAVLNLLPFPGLDGGRLVFLGYELVTRRKVNERVEAWVHTIGILAIVLLILGVTVFGDLPRLLR